MRKVHYGLAVGGDPNFNSQDSGTPLLFHVLGLPAFELNPSFDVKWLNVCELLIQNGCRVNEQDYTRYESTNVYPIIQEKGVSKNTALHHANYNRVPILSRYLLSKDADTTMQVCFVLDLC